MVAPPVEAQLNVDAAELGTVIWDWFDGWIRALAADAVEELASLPVKPVRQPERPGEASGMVSVRRARPAGPPAVTDVNASTAGLAWLRTELADPPEVAEVRFFRLEPGPGRSPHLLYARANVHPPSPGWVQLQTTVSSAVFADPGRQRLWLDTLFELADRLDSGYGQLGFYLEGGATALEDAFDNRVVPLERRLPAHTIGAARRALRGYSWVTIVPKELASTVDDTSSFVDVRPLSGGGLWLRATEDFRGYDEAAAGRVFAALAPVLAAGLPVRRRLVPDEAPQLLAFEDAAAHRTGSHGR